MTVRDIFYKRSKSSYFIKSSVLSALLFLILSPISGQSLQHVQLLHSKDTVFQQLSQDIMENYRRAGVGKSLLPLNIFTYRTQQNDTIYSIAARLNIPYDTIATLNSISSPSLFPRGEIIYLPNMSGLATRSDENDPFLGSLEDRLKKDPSFGLELPGIMGQRIPAKFYPTQRFSAAERTTFLSSFLLPPLKGSAHIVTSRFGRRVNPFNPGRWEIHTGVDYRAPLKSSIYASRFGQVISVANSPVLGVHVIIQHERKYQTIYGHLSHALVKPGDRVSSGQIIAESGNTGRSSGPHLHFEVRKDGLPINPLPFLRKKN